jgi:hypothetical protein
MTLSVPRDRAGTFDPKLIAKYQRRFPDFDEKIISMYARGMTVREIRGHLEELYGTYRERRRASAPPDATHDTRDREVYSRGGVGSGGGDPGTTIASLSDAYQQALRIKCRDVIKRPANYTANIVALCQLLVVR